MSRGFFKHSAEHSRAGSMSSGNRTSGPNRRGGRKRQASQEQSTL